MCDKDVNDKDKEPRILYKYRTLQQFLDYFDDYLAGKIYFADRKTLNDPMENAPLPDRFILKGGSENEYKECIEDWEAVLKINPNSIPAKINIEKVRKMRGY